MVEDFNGKYKKQFNYIVSHYQFRFNVVTSFYEYRKLEFGKRSRTKTKIGGPWKKYDDRIRNLILLELMEHDLDISQDKFNIFIESEIVSKDYNPFLEYFENLEPWDGKTDYIEQLSKTVTTFDADHFRSTLQRFFVGALECLLEEDAVNDVCLVFQSEQGIGKTRWMRSLLPKKFQSEYLYEGNIDTKNKDHTMYLSQYWFIHLDELETLKSNDISAIKSFITRQRISVRKAFGRYKTNFIRRASFLGSVNDDKFLTDITGNRRWLVFKTTNIDYEHEVEIDKLWAQVYHLWQSGFKHWFDITEIKVINKINEEFRSMNLEEEMLLQHYEFDYPESGKGEYLGSFEVLSQFGKDNGHIMSKLNSKNMGRALAKHSKDKKRRQGVSKYYVVWKGLDLNKDTNPKERDEEAAEILEHEKANRPLETMPEKQYIPDDTSYDDDDGMPF
jgi:predicted P-loop ATPase